MKKIFMVLFIAAGLLACNNEKKDDASAGETKVKSANDTKPANEILDMSEADVVKSSYTALSKGDIDGMTANFADTIFYVWSNLDSLRGKAAVQDFWKKRWPIIDSVNISEQIWLPIKTNESQSKYSPTGKWVLLWALIDVKYKNNKKVKFWAHYVHHFNSDGKIDVLGSYYDRTPILEATKDLIK